jgi:hypothetical protein
VAGVPTPLPPPARARFASRASRLESLNTQSIRVLALVIPPRVPAASVIFNDALSSRTGSIVP